MPLQLLQLWRRVGPGRLRVGPEQHVAEKPHHRADCPLVDGLVLLGQARQRFHRRVEHLGEPRRRSDREQREVPVPQGLRQHLVRRRADGGRQRRCGRPREAPGHGRHEEARQVDEDGVKLLAPGGGEEADDGPHEAHVEGLRVLLAALRHELHHRHEDRRGGRKIAREAEDVAERQADLLHQLLVLRVVEADPLDGGEVLLDDGQDRMAARLIQTLWTRRGHVVDARDGGDVELQLQRRLPVARRLDRPGAQGLGWQGAEDLRERLLHARHEDVEHPPELVPIVEHGEHLADAEDQLRAAVYVEPRVRHEGDDRGDHVLPEGAAILRHDDLAGGGHHHLHGVAREGLAVLLHVGVGRVLEAGYGRQVLERQEPQDQLAGQRVEREVARGEEDQAARGAAQEQRLEALRVVGQLRQELNQLGDHGVLPGRRPRRNSSEDEDARVDVFPSDRVARADFLEQGAYVVDDPARRHHEARLRDVDGAHLAEADELVPLEVLLLLGLRGIPHRAPVRLDHLLDVRGQDGLLLLAPQGLLLLVARPTLRGASSALRCHLGLLVERIVVLYRRSAEVARQRRVPEVEAALREVGVAERAEVQRGLGDVVERPGGGRGRAKFLGVRRRFGQGGGRGGEPVSDDQPREGAAQLADESPEDGRTDGQLRVRRHPRLEVHLRQRQHVLASDDDGLHDEELHRTDLRSRLVGQLMHLAEEVGARTAELEVLRRPDVADRLSRLLHERVLMQGPLPNNLGGEGAVAGPGAAGIGRPLLQAQCRVCVLQAQPPREHTRRYHRVLLVRLGGLPQGL
mmetsp:Transcript_114081/g.323019  ORF Transcript_114081/g.323019 Transcript_114081/m.323019 type:complete len:801 (+) Transcript_114081:486-2888(+)